VGFTGRLRRFGQPDRTNSEGSAQVFGARAWRMESPEGKAGQTGQ
jgi:hypothetical protein